MSFQNCLTASLGGGSATSIFLSFLNSLKTDLVLILNKVFILCLSAIIFLSLSFFDSTASSCLRCASNSSSLLARHSLHYVHSFEFSSDIRLLSCHVVHINAF